MPSLPQDAPLPPARPPSRIGRGPVVQFRIWAGAGAMVVGGGVTLLTGIAALPMVLGFGGYWVGVTLADRLLRRGFPHPTLGACNVVTLLRLALAAALLAPLAGAAGPWAVFGLAVLGLGLDGVDGFLARRAGRESHFGARFDMEVDSALALILALNVWAAGTAGALVLVIGLPRYLFVVAGRLMPWLRGTLPPRLSRKAVCVVQVAALIVLQLPVLPQGLATPLVAGVALVLAWSFGRDVVWLWRVRT